MPIKVFSSGTTHLTLLAASSRTNERSKEPLILYSPFESVFQLFTLYNVDSKCLSEINIQVAAVGQISKGAGTKNLIDFVEMLLYLEKFIFTKCPSYV